MDISFTSLMKAFSNREYTRNIAGPLMMALGIFLLVSPVARTTGILQNVVLFTAGVLVLGGIVVTYIGVVRQAPSVSTLAESTSDDLSLAVKQLSRNYEWIRNQTIYAFYLSTVFMALGVLVILFGSIRVVLGLTENADNLTIIAGLISEFISGSALLLYRSSSQRLNEVSKELHQSWKILAAYKLAKDLPKAHQKEAIYHLIYAMAGVPIAKVNPK
jgi:TRADD-N domain-containing protein